MKKTNIISESPIIHSPHQFTPNIVKKSPKKEFQLLYRERDQTFQENPIESIIFFKSKPCNPIYNSKKTKVHHEFKKIMHDLENHINQHQKNINKFCPSSISQTKRQNLSIIRSQTGELFSSKYDTKEKNSLKKSKTANNEHDRNKKDKSQKIQTSRLHKTCQKDDNLKKRKILLDAQSPKLQKQNFKQKEINQNRIGVKSPNKRLNIKDKIDQLQQEKLLRKKSFIQNSLQTNRNVINQSEDLKKTFISRNIKKIPLKVQQYIWLEDSFELIKRKSLYNLEAKILQTYRNNFKQFQTNILFKQNSQSLNIFRSINFVQPVKVDQNLVQNSQINLTSKKSSFCLQSQSQDNNFNLINPFFYLSNIQKIIVIQKWWRKILYQKDVKVYDFRYINKKINKKSYQNSLSKIYFTTPANLPSAGGIGQENELELQQKCDQNKIIQQQNENLGMLKSQNKIVKQKRQIHEKILQNLVFEQKITKDEFDCRMKLIQQEFENELNQIFGLYRLCDIKTEQNQQFNQGRKNRNQNHLEKRNLNFEDKQKQFGNNFNQNLENDSDQTIQKLGHKITSNIQSYISNAHSIKKLQKELSIGNFHTQSSNNRKTELGEEFDDLNSKLSNDSSPYKMIEYLSYDQFEADISGQNKVFLQPNANFMQVLEQFKEQTQIKSQIQKRIAQQMGAFRSQSSCQFSIDTSILGIHYFLVNFFKFYLNYYKDEFLKFINMPYGYQPEKRLKFIQGYQDNNDNLYENEEGVMYGLEYVISDDIFQQFIQQFYSNSFETASQKEKSFIEYSKVHDRAIFECFNEALNYFRPYYTIGGPPYIWNCSQKTLTFYFIDQDNIQEVFQKTQFRVMKASSALLGLYVEGKNIEQQNLNGKNKNNFNEQKKNGEKIFQYNNQKSHVIINQNREERLIKEEKLSLIQTISKWSDHQEQKTQALYEISSLILEKLVQEFSEQFFMQS